MIREMNLDAEDGLTFKAGVILMYIAQTSEFGLQTISEWCDYNYNEVEIIMNNFRANGIVTPENKFDIDIENEETSGMEFMLTCMAGGGTLVRTKQDA